MPCTDTASWVRESQADTKALSEHQFKGLPPCQHVASTCTQCSVSYSTLLFLPACCQDSSPCPGLEPGGS